MTITNLDDALREVLTPHAKDGWLSYDVRTRVEWGRPVDASR